MSATLNWPICAIAFSFIIIVWRHCVDLYEWEQKQEIPITFNIQEHFYQTDVEVGEIGSNCGIPDSCPEGTMSIYISTGHKDEGDPKLCFGGKYFIEKDINGGGRGMNALIVEPTLFQLVAVRNFDTYRYDSSLELNSWLDSLLDNDILIIFTSDEASSRLNTSTRERLNNLGSGKIQDLSYRAQWFMVTQKGSSGFAVYENITFPTAKSAWGEMIEFRTCLPRNIPKQPVSVDPPPWHNVEKEFFCRGRTEYRFKAFCTSLRFQLFTPALLTNRSLIGNPVFSVPIFLFASEGFELFLASLDSLFHQPGILASGITVFYNESNRDVVGICNIYRVKSIALKKNETRMRWENKIQFVRNFLHTNQPSQHFMIIDQDTIPTSDFLFFFGQTFPIMLKDPTITAISAMSPQCYKTLGNPYAAYRIEGTPQHAGLFKLEKLAKDVTDIIIAPDVPRIQGPTFCHVPSTDSGTWIERPQDLTKERYFHKLVMLQQISTPVDVYEFLQFCSFRVTSNFYIIYYSENRLLMRILICLNIFNNQIGQYEGTSRSSYNGKHVLIVHSSSPFYKSKPVTNQQ